MQHRIETLRKSDELITDKATSEHILKANSTRRYHWQNSELAHSQAHSFQVVNMPIVYVYLSPQAEAIVKQSLYNLCLARTLGN